MKYDVQMGKRKLFCGPLDFFDFLRVDAWTDGASNAPDAPARESLREKFFRGLPKKCDFFGVESILGGYNFVGRTEIWFGDLKRAQLQIMAFRMIYGLPG